MERVRAQGRWSGPAIGILMGIWGTVGLVGCAQKTPKAGAKSAAVKAKPAKKKVKPTKSSPAQAKAVAKRATPTSGAFTPDSALYVCPKITVSNRPRTNRERKILAYKPFVKVGKVSIAVAPQNGACLTSGFGQRRGRPHNGIDYQGKPAPLIHAAAAGTIREAKYRDDYGRVVLIDHGHGVFTRYAHLKYIQKGIKAGKKVPFGATLGRMGQTSKYKVALHLHYEVLTGNYDTPKKSFGLKPVNILALLK